MTQDETYAAAQNVHNLSTGLVMLIEFLTGRVLKPVPYSADWQREFGDWLNQVTISAEMIAHHGSMSGNAATLLDRRLSMCLK